MEIHNNASRYEQTALAGKGFPLPLTLCLSASFLLSKFSIPSSTERLGFALMLGRHPVPARALPLPVSTGTLYTGLPASQEMLSLLPPARESPSSGVVTGSRWRGKAMRPRSDILIASAPQHSLDCTAGGEEPFGRDGGQPFRGICTVLMLSGRRGSKRKTSMV